jgi:nucleoside-diphosphate-sugar epimerase
MTGNSLLFGGSGFIGYHLTNLLNESKRSKPYIFDIADSRSKDVCFEKVDVREVITTSYEPQENDVICNLAAVHRTPGHPSHEYFETNLLGAENVCNYAREHKIKTIVFTSSIATYGTYENQKNEKTIPMPDIPYGISKLSAEYIHKLWQQEDPNNRKLIIVRPGVVFGEYENGNFTRLINSISKKRFFYPGRKDTIKACIYVKDLVKAMSSMIEKEKTGICTYNMTYEVAPSIEKICSVISKQGELSSPKIILPSMALLLLSKVLYFFTKNEGVHPDRVRKLMISNNISGKKLNTNYELEYGLEGGLLDWMKETNFFKNKVTY